MVFFNRFGKTKLIFDFSIFSGQPVGPEDYLSLCNRFKVFFVDQVPKFATLNNGNVMVRWITFIDIIYERNIGLVFSADADLSDLVKGLNFKSDGTIIGVKESREEVQGDTIYKHRPEHLTIEDAAEFAGNEDIKFACKRMLSRLNEMRGNEYWMNHKSTHGDFGI